MFFFASASQSLLPEKNFAADVKTCNYSQLNLQPKVPGLAFTSDLKKCLALLMNPGRLKDSRGKSWSLPVRRPSIVSRLGTITSS